MINFKKHSHEGYYCPHCGIHLAPYDIVYLDMGNIVMCDECKDEEIFYDCSITVSNFAEQPFMKGGEY